MAFMRFGWLRRGCIASTRQPRSSAAPEPGDAAAWAAIAVAPIGTIMNFFALIFSAIVTTVAYRVHQVESRCDQTTAQDRRDHDEEFRRTQALRVSDWVEELGGAARGAAPFST